jgi:signal transduction histidine kinase/CheY-like chemotaxis protein
VIGKTDYDASWKELAELHQADDQIFMDRNVTRSSFEEPGISADGQPRWLRTSKTPLHDQQGNVTGILGTYEDVTEYKLAKLEIERLNAELEQRVALRTEDLFAATQEALDANRAKSEFLSRTSHELRTPLNAILGFGQLLETTGRDSEDADNIRQILSAGRHLLDLVNEVLDISGLEAGNVEIKVRPIEVSEVINEALAAVRALAAERDVTLGSLLCDSRVLVDRQRFTQVILHLLFNAIKYNKRGGGVTLAAQETGGFLRLTITDTGAGIAAGDIAKIFTAFERLNVAGRVDGIGLGLTISRQLVEMMGGRIGVQSAPGEGSAFWIDLPVAPSLMALPCHDSAPAMLVSESNAPSCISVLYVQQSQESLRLITRVVARRPAIKLFSAGTWQAGLETVCDRRPDLILLDPASPEGNGLHTLARMRADPRISGIPIVILATEASPERRAEALAAGADAVVAKPVDVRSLLGVLDQMLGLQPKQPA